MTTKADIIFEDREGNLLALVPDTVITEGPHRIGNVATQQEVEAGAQVTDHVRPESDTLELEVVFSNTPIRPIEVPADAFGFEVTGALGNIEGEIPSGPKLTAFSQPGPPAKGPELGKSEATTIKGQAWQPDGEEITRIQDNWALIRQSRDNAYLGVITTDMHTYESMVLISAETTRRAEDGSWIRVLLSFRQIRQVATELVDVAVPARPRNQRRRDEGSQPTDELDDKETEDVVEAHRRTSIADRVVGSIFG